MLIMIRTAKQNFNFSKYISVFLSISKQLGTKILLNITFNASKQKEAE